MNNYLTIPKTIYLTHYNDKVIPEKVWLKLNSFASDYVIKYFNDEQCETFIRQYFDSKIVSIFKNLRTGAHKADLFRYCILYKFGGVYLDIKIEPFMNLTDIFDHNTNNLLYTCLSDTHIFQGIIASYANNDIFLDLINDFLYLDDDFFNINMTVLDDKYHYFTFRFYFHLQNRIKSELKIGNNIYSDQTIILFEEKEIQVNNEEQDRYGHWNIFNNLKQRIFKSRYNDYPWTESSTYKKQSCYLV